MDTRTAKRLHDRTLAARVRYRRTRIRHLAHRLTSEPVVVEGRTCRHGEHSVRKVVPHTFAYITVQGAPTSDDVRADILWRQAEYMKRSVGRRAQGVEKPTCKVRDHKSRKCARVEHSKRTFTHTVDLRRTYADKSAPYRPGGAVWASVNKRAKRRFRALLHKADQLFSAGEITVALEALRAL